MIQRCRRLLGLLSFLLFSVTLYYFSPYLSLAGVWQGVAAGSLFVFGGLFFLSFFTGRLFCGWLCPTGAYQDWLRGVSDKPRLRGRWVRWVVFIPWSLLLAAGVVRSGGLNIDFFWQTTGGISVAEPAGYIVYFGVLFVFGLLALLSGRRGGCHSICWMSPFMNIGMALGRILRIPRLSLKVREERCVHCSACNRICPMSRPVETLVRDNRINAGGDCILCGECVSVCPGGVIRYAFHRGD